MTTRFYIGSEVEHTPAFSKKTLFVLGEQPIVDVLKFARIHSVRHVSLASERTFNESIDYNDSIIQLIAEGLYVTLEYPIDMHQHMLDTLSSEIWSSKLFVPLVRCVVPGLHSCNNNLVIKIDDTDFQGSNGGVWCWDKNGLLDNNRYSEWRDYQKVNINEDNEVGIINTVCDMVTDTFLNIVNIAATPPSDVLVDEPVPVDAEEPVDYTHGEGTHEVVEPEPAVSEVVVDHAEVVAEPEEKPAVTKAKSPKAKPKSKE